MGVIALPGNADEAETKRREPRTYCRWIKRLVHVGAVLPFFIFFNNQEAVWKTLELHDVETAGTLHFHYEQIMSSANPTGAIAEDAAPADVLVDEKTELKTKNNASDGSTKGVSATASGAAAESTPRNISSSGSISISSMVDDADLEGASTNKTTLDQADAGIGSNDAEHNINTVQDSTTTMDGGNTGGGLQHVTIPISQRIFHLTSTTSAVWWFRSTRVVLLRYGNWL